MNVIIIGSGNVAFVLGKLMRRSGINILQVKSRNSENGKALSELLECRFSLLSELNDVRADLILMAVSDNALTPHPDFIQHTKIPIIHTAGSVPAGVLSPYSSSYGVLYPLQTLRKEMNEIPEIPFLVDASDEKTLIMIEQLAGKLSPLVRRADDATRHKIHLAAVFVNNFSNHLFTLAADYCNKEQLDFKMLLPLIQETVNRLHFFAPEKVQTGPAIRNDITTMEKHLSLLDQYPELKKMYLTLSSSIIEHQR